jgi:hypothetical protein
METEYKKDLKHNYLVITEVEHKSGTNYCVKMLEHQKIEGILMLEQRRLDDKTLYYYDISSRQSMAAILDRTSLTKDKIISLCKGIISTLERAYEYLLPEEDFILTPEYIYMEVASNEPSLCFLSGYNRPIKEQISGLLEYLMNRVDYNDREAVLLIYRLYAVSREEGYTLEHLIQELQELPLDETIEQVKSGTKAGSKEGIKVTTKSEIKAETRLETKSDNNRHVAINRGQVMSASSQEVDIRKEKNIPVMMEKLEKEVEISYYPVITYLCTAASIAGGFLLFALSWKTKAIYNTYGKQMDYIKLAALLLIIFCCEGYLMKMLWDKKYKTTRIIRKNEYVDPRQLMGQATLAKKAVFENTETYLQKQRTINGNNPLQQITKDEIPGSTVMHKRPEHGEHPKEYDNSKKVNNSKEYENSKEYDNPTCLLNGTCEDISISYSASHTPEFLLRALDKENYQSIAIESFPFFIGKLKKNVDYCLEKDVVSRYHAKVLKEDNRYFIMDMNSTNGTYVNGESIKTYEKREVSRGDEVSLADIKFKVEFAPD